MITPTLCAQRLLGRWRRPSDLVTRTWLLALVFTVVSPATLFADDAKRNETFVPAKPITRVLPPDGIALADGDLTDIQSQTKELESRLNSMRGKSNESDIADVELFLKAIRYAILHNEFYDRKDLGKTKPLLAEASRRLDSLSTGKRPWHRETGTVVRGYRSELDESVQPFGLVIPKDHDFEKPSPLYVWLHGRGDKQTDLHFIHERLSKPGQIAPPNAIVLHPFGRHCVAFKFAGELDVFESIAQTARDYKIDPKRIVLIGFSMGGAGAWHLGAHYSDRWVAVSPGAGFAETARYRRLKPEEFPPRYEQSLWGFYDVPDYVRNLFNVPTIAYSGELDKQIQAARVMEEAFQKEGQTLRHLIGPKVEHKYEPETLKVLLSQIDGIVQQRKADRPNEVHVQTKTLRYGQVAWVKIERLKEHWSDSRVDASITGDKSIRATTKNIVGVRFSPWEDMSGKMIEIDGQTLTLKSKSGELAVRDGKWQEGSGSKADLAKGATALAKRPFLQGPIDDAFMGPTPFVVVEPSSSSDSTISQWCRQEYQHFSQRWRCLMRGELPSTNSIDAAEKAASKKHIAVWGDPSTNALLKQLNGKLPVKWSGGEFEFRGKRYNASRFVPAFIYPNPLAPERYLVVNSGITFREGHDSTNSNQTPKLPDWAIIDMTTAADSNSPGLVVEAGFFDENWEAKVVERN